MPTPNINLEEILLTDKISSDMLNKINNNMQKIDTKYGQLKDSLLERTGKETLEEALEEVTLITNRYAELIALGNARNDEISAGKTAVVQGIEITGTGGVVIPTVTISVTGSYASYISGYGYGFDANGRMVIWAMSNTTSYEHIYFNASSIVGTKENGWDISSYDTSDPANVPHACTTTGLESYKTINITLNASAINSSYDRIQLDVTITGTN